MLAGDSYLFLKYLDKYVIRKGGDGLDAGDWAGISDDAPEEVKRSWEEYQKHEEERRKQGIK